MQTVDVLLPRPLDKAYTYTVPQGLTVEIGDLVTVPVRNQQTRGVVWSDGSPHDTQKLKPIINKIDSPSIPKQSLEFINWTAKYTMAPLGSILRMVISVPKALETEKLKPLAPQPSINFTPVALSSEQADAAKTVCDAVDGNTFAPMVLDGVTGSGKTEVYFEAIAKAIAQGKQALVLLPEISLSTQWLERFTARFGTTPTIWHSSVTPAKRRDSWRAIISGQAKVVVGARSALYLPYPNLGLIIVDEEHDPAYKQEDQVIYNGRDMAIVRANIGKIPILLVSATPSLETITNCNNHRYKHIQLSTRHKGAQLPDVAAIDMRQHRTERGEGQTWLSNQLRHGITKTLAAGEQVMLFLNRRGYAPLTLCGTCGERVCCPNCAAWLVEHKSSGHMLCHHCGHSLKRLKDCPKCNSKDSLVPCGPGVERVAEEAQSLFNTHKIAVMASDTMTTPKAMAELLQNMQNGDIDILIGTQMMTKGHHFPNLTLVGVVDADLGLSGGDLRASERTYQLLHQVAGRAGRAERPGRALLQTYMPEHAVIKAMIAGDRDSYLNLEAQSRKMHQLPPFGRLAALILSSTNAQAVEQTARNLARCAPRSPEVEVLGPAPAALAKIRGRHRWRLLLKTTLDRRVQPLLHQWLSSFDAPPNVRIQIDIDPYSFW